MTWQDDLVTLLRRVAQNYDEIAQNLEAGAPEVRHPRGFGEKASDRTSGKRKEPRLPITRLFQIRDRLVGGRSRRARVPTRLMLN
jgi:hypothetical protein